MAECVFKIFLESSLKHLFIIIRFSVRYMLFSAEKGEQLGDCEMKLPNVLARENELSKQVNNRVGEKISVNAIINEMHSEYT